MTTGTQTIGLPKTEVQSHASGGSAHASSGNLASHSGFASMSMNTHMRGMPRSTASSATPDLFNYVPSTPVLGARRTPVKVKPLVAEVSQLSDARLALLLRELMSELQRRKAEGTGRESRPELDQAFMTQPVLWRTLSHGRQDAQDAQREQMLPRNCRSRGAKPSGRLMPLAWRPVRSPGTSACRLPLCARCSQAPSRAWRTGRLFIL
jgi:hypothetical protein